MVCSVWSHDTEAEEITLDIYKNKEKMSVARRVKSEDKFLKKNSLYIIKVLSLNTPDVSINIHASFPVSCPV